jgi:2-polyprenyl-3-methyl-5-hydroxy-6-metoxy-1,4-benzoquinol methylase
VVQCRVCGLVYAEPLDEAALRALYSREYFQGLTYVDYLSDREAIHKNAGRALRELAALGRGRRLLDVGCAAGFFLEAARSAGFSVSGIELSDFASTYAREKLGLAVTTGALEDLSADAGPFDAVTLWDCVEHLRRPDQALARVRAHMETGGVLMLSTGDHDSLLRRLTGRRWRLFADPTHNFFFTETTLRRLLAQAGFTVERVSRRGKWVSLPMILKQAPLVPGALRGALSKRLARAYLYLNLWDVVTVTARAA